MKLIWLEGKRIAKKGWVLLCFTAFLILGLWISGLLLERSFQNEGCSVEQYLEAAQSCSGMALSEAAKYMSEKANAALQAVEICQDYRMGIMGFGEAAEKLISLGYGETSPDDLTFSALVEEWKKYLCVGDEIDLLLQYEDRIKEIQQGAGGLSGISFFEADNYLTLTKEKAMRDYAGLYVELRTWQPNVSARAFLQNRAMDGFIFLFLTVAVLLLFMEEKEKGYAALTVTTRGGRRRFYCKKAGTLLGFTLITVSVYEGALLACFIWRLGGVDLGAPIQSIAVFEMCCHGYSVGTVIILTVLLKILFFYITALALSALACLMSKTLSFFSLITMIVLLSVVWERTADINGSLGWLTCFNPVGLTDAAGMITRYRQFPILGEPISGTWLTGIFMGLLAPASIAAGLLLYAGTAGSGETFFGSEKAGRAFGQIRRTVCGRVNILLERYGKRGRAKPRRLWTNGAFWLELKKSMISYRMLLPVLLVILTCVAAYFALDGKPMTREEQFYRDYMMELNGPLTPEKERFLLEERERFDNLEVFRNELIAQGEGQDLLLSFIESEMVKKSAFDLVWQQYARVQQEGGVFFYETGYLYLMGILENESGRTGVLLGILCLTLLLPYLCWIELGGGADGLIRTTARGRGGLLFIQYAVYFLTAVLLFGSICAEDAAQIFGQFGSYGLSRAAGNISQLGGFLSGCSVGGYLILIYTLRLLGAALAALIIMACMYRCRDYLNTVFVCGILLVIPYVLFMNGFSFMTGYFLNAFLQGEEFLMLIRRREIGEILLIGLQVVLCLGVSFRILEREVKRQ